MKWLPVPWLLATNTLLLADVAPQGRRILEPFDYRPVRLDAGFMKTQFDEICGYYMAISNDNILHQFRHRAGLPPPGEKLIGAAHGGASADKLGQWLSGLSRMYAFTGDKSISDKVNALVDEWEKTIARDGSFSCCWAFGTRQTRKAMTSHRTPKCREYSGVERPGFTQSRQNGPCRTGLDAFVSRRKSLREKPLTCGERLFAPGVSS